MSEIQLLARPTLRRLRGSAALALAAGLFLACASARGPYETERDKTAAAPSSARPSVPPAP